MNSSFREPSNQRRAHGSSIAEFGPVLFIILVVVLFPMIDLVALGLTYNCGNMLNAWQLRESAVTRATLARNNTGPIKKTIVDSWRTKGIGAFAKVDPASISTKVNYASAGVGNDISVEVVTKMTADPFLPVPFFVKVPGLNESVPFQYSTQQLLEDPLSYDLTDTTDPTKAANLPNKE
jgi:hypothetical protein